MIFCKICGQADDPSVGISIELTAEGVCQHCLESPDCPDCESNPVTERLGVPFCRQCADEFDYGFNNG